MVLSNKLVEIIEHNADQLSRRWIELVRTDECTPTYHSYDEDKLYERAFSVYSHLGDWLSAGPTQEEVTRLYTELGRQRHREGFQLSELLQALILTRRVLWTKIQMDGLFDTALDLNQALDLRNQTIRFFDRAMVCAAKGYESV
jgi:hypothetical protein